MLIERAHADVSVVLRSLAAGLADRNIAILHQGTDMVYDLVENLPDFWPEPHPSGQSDAALGSLDWARPWLEAKRAVLASGQPKVMEFAIPQANARRIVEARIRPDADAHGRPRGLITVLTDVTDLREREIAIASLMREVSHRSKNLLAIVLSLAAQTAHHSDGIASFLQKFRGRIQALSGIQDLVTEANWHGIAFSALLERELARAGQTSRHAVEVTGEDPRLGPNAALHVGLALHELATNAQLFGALSRPGAGSILVSAHLVRDAETVSEAVIEWRESCEPAPDAIPVPRFGTLVLERIVPLSVGGSAEHQLDQHGVRYALHVPAGQLES